MEAERAEVSSRQGPAGRASAQNYNVRREVILLLLPVPTWMGGCPKCS